eukprot:759865-Hanusia_phi.AAC.4
MERSLRLAWQSGWRKTSFAITREQGCGQALFVVRYRQVEVELRWEERTAGDDFLTARHIKHEKVIVNGESWITMRPRSVVDHSRVWDEGILDVCD